LSIRKLLIFLNEFRRAIVIITGERGVCLEREGGERLVHTSLPSIFCNPLAMPVYAAVHKGSGWPWIRSQSFQIPLDFVVKFETLDSAEVL
jgi:hypothetical protein